MSARMLVIAWKELLQLRRDRPTVAMMVALPVMQLLVFGYAINTDVRHIPTIVFDQDHTASSRDLWRSMEVTTFYDVVGHVESCDDIARSLRSGTAKVAVVIPVGYSSDLTRGSTAQVQLIVDGSDPQTVASATNTLSSLVNARSAELLLKRAAKTASSPMAQPLELRQNTWYNPDLLTAIYVVPGIVGVILTMTMVMLTSMAIARERERGTLEQLIVSPVTRFELVIGKIAPYVIIGFVQMTLILGIGAVVFHVPMVGSIGLLYAISFLFISANLALGLFFSTLAKTQQQAMQMSFFFLLPNILLSGFAFPFEGMPLPAQWFAEALPLTHFLRVVRGIVLKGSQFDDIKTELMWLVVILVVWVTLGSLRFSKKLE